MKKLISKTHFRFYKVPSKVYSLGLTSNELLLLIYLISLSGFDFIYPSKKTISDNIGISKRTTDKTIDLLVKRGFISYKKGGKNISNQYYIHFDKIDNLYYKSMITKTNLEKDCDKMINKSIYNLFC